MDKTLIKGLRLLELLARSPGPRSITELAGELELYKSNIHRVLKTLIHCGFVLQLADGRYTSTLRLWELGNAVFERLDIRAVARPVLERLGQRTGEDVYLAVLDGLQTVYVDRLESVQPMRPHYRLGTRLPSYCNSAGKAMLAQLGEEAVNAATTRLRRYTDTTLATRDEVLKDLERIRQRGYAVNDCEREAGVRSVAAAVLDGIGAPIASFSIIVPEQHLPVARFETLGRLAIEAARQVEAVLQGHKRPEAAGARADQAMARPLADLAS